MPIVALLHGPVHHFHGPPIDYLGLALAAAASWVGVPGPGEPVLIAAGVFAARHKLDLTAVLLVAWAAASAGGIAGWIVGLKAGRALVSARGPLRSTRLKAVARGQDIFARYPVAAIILTPSWIAGIHGVRAAVFLPVNTVGCALWAGGIGVGAYLLGPTVVDFVDDLGAVALVGIGGLVLVAGASELRRRRRHGGRGETSG